MFHPPPIPQSVELVQELNRMFLRFLQTLARKDHESPELPQRIAGALRRAPPSLLDAAGSVPRALFKINLAVEPDVEEISGRITAPPDPLLESGRLAVNLTVLSAAWNLAHQSDYQARLLLGLAPATVHRLRTLGVGELPSLACAPRLLSCAFVPSGVFWERLLKPSSTEMSRELTLIMLQPIVNEHLSAYILNVDAARRLSQ